MLSLVGAFVESCSYIPDHPNFAVHNRPHVVGVDVNPFTAPACKISELTDARTNLRTVYFPVL